jgi:hypothetical protein
VIEELDYCNREIRFGHHAESCILIGSEMWLEDRPSEALRVPGRLLVPYVVYLYDVPTSNYRTVRSTVPLIITKSYEKFKSARPTPPSILVRFSKKLAHSKIQPLNFRVGAFFRNDVMLPRRSRPCRFAAPFLLLVFSSFLLARQNL